jgi:hypothetical protein
VNKYHKLTQAGRNLAALAVTVGSRNTRAKLNQNPLVSYNNSHINVPVNGRAAAPNLPRNVVGHIGSFLTGIEEKGVGRHINEQKIILQEKTSRLPYANGATRKRTRKNKK